MKTKFKLSIAIICSLIIINEAPAQSFWKKLGKAAEQIGKELITIPADSTGTKSTATETKTATATETKVNINPFKDVVAISPVNGLEINILGCEPSDKYVVLVYTITNRGPEFGFRIRGSSPPYKSNAIDEFGNQYWLKNYFGNVADNNGREAYNTLPTDVPIKIQTVISNVSPQANKLTQVKILSSKGDFIIKNVPIIRSNVSVQSSTTSTDCNEALDAQKINDIFYKKYGVMPSKRLKINDNKLLYYHAKGSDLEAMGCFFIFEKNNCVWNVTKIEEIGTLAYGSTIDSIQIVSVQGKDYLYYESYMTGGSAGNYDIYFGLYDYDMYQNYTIDYSFYPTKEKNKSSVNLISSDNLKFKPVLSDFLRNRMKLSSRTEEAKKARTQRRTYGK